MQNSMLTEEITQWSRVARVVYRVEQRYQYTYSAPVRALHHHFRVVPRQAHGDQQLLSHEIAVAGASDQPAIAWDRDIFGNPICTVQAEHIAEAVTFEASYRVERVARSHDGGRVGALEAPMDLAPFLEPTPLTAPDDALTRAAELIQASSPGSRGGRIAPFTGRPPRSPTAPALPTLGRRRPRHWPAARASARTTATFCSRCFACWASRPGTSPDTSSAKARPTRGWRHSSVTPQRATASASSATTPQIAWSLGCATSQSRWDATSPT